MANKKISELQSRTPALSDLMLVGDPSSGYSYKCTVTALATIIETDIADGYVTIGTTQTISGAKTFSNNLTLTSVVNTPTDPDKFLTLNASNVVTYRTGSQVLSDIGAADDSLVVHLAGTEVIIGVKTFNAQPVFNSGISIPNGNSIIFNGTSTLISGNASSNELVFTTGNTLRATINNSGLTLNTLSAATIDTDRFLVSDSGVIKYRTGAEVLSDIGGASASSISGTTNYVAKFTSSSAIGNSAIYSNTSGNVSIGNTNDAYKLDVSGTVRSTSNFVVNNGTVVGNYAIETAQVQIGTFSNHPFVLTTFNTERVRIDTSGNVTFSQIANATTDTDKFLVSDSGVLKYRTGAEVLSDIGGQGALTLTTSGSSGAATLVGNTLNIPNYGSALSGYVPYTGATTNVNLGTRYLQANYLVVDGQSNATGINFKQYSSVSFNGDGYTAMGPVSVDKMFFNFAQGSNIFKIFYFDVSGITGNATRAYTMPNSDGTLALTSQIPTVSGTTNYIPKFTSSSAIGNSIMSEGSGIINVGGDFNAVRLTSTDTYLQVANGVATFNITQSANGSTYLYNYGAYNLIFGTTGSERMRLTSGGLLGLGTSSPSRTLSIGGAANAYMDFKSSSNRTYTIGSDSNGFIVFDDNASAYRMVINASGNLGLGTSAPSGSGWDESSTVLHIYKNAINGGLLKLESSNTTAILNAGNDQLAIFTTTNDPIRFGTNGSERMRLDASGNLGLGTTVMNAKLNVENTSSGSSATGIVIRNSGSTVVNTQARLLLSTVADDNRGAFISSIITSGSNDNALLFGTNSAGNSPTEKMRLDASGNLGLGVTPSAWSSSYKAIQISSRVSLAGDANQTVLGNNWFTNTSGTSTYIATAQATVYSQTSGEHRWFNAPSGTANTTISFTQAMTLDASGRLLIGTTTSPSATSMKAVVVGASGGDAYYEFANSAGGGGAIGSNSGAGINFYTFTGAVGSESFTHRMVINSSGNVGISTASPAYKFQVGDLANTSGVVNDIFITGDRVNTNNYYARLIFGNSSQSGGSTASIRGERMDGSNFGTGLTFYTNGTGSAGDGSERMRITSGGNVLVGTTTSDGSQFRVYGGYMTLGDGAYEGLIGKASTIISGGNTGDLGIRSAGGISISSGGNTERVRITSNGNVVIRSGEAVPSQMINGLFFSKVSDDSYITSIFPGNYYTPLTLNASQQIFQTNGSERMRITSGGDIGVSATSVIGSGFGYAGNTGASASAYLQLYNGASGETKLWNTGYYAMIFGNGNSERMRLNSSGELLINTTSDAGDYKLQVNGYGYFSSTYNGGGIGMLHLTSNGTEGGTITFDKTSGTAQKYKIGNSGTEFFIYNETGANKPLALLNNGNAEFGGSIKTAAPSGGTAQPWKLGSKVTQGGILSLDVSNYIQVEINGTVWKLGVVN